MAKKFDVLCHDYSIGMGPAIYKKKGKETTFCVRAIPIGGFVSMAGEEATDYLTKVGTKVGLNLEDDIVTEIILDDAKDAMVRGEINDKDLDGKDGKDLYITLMDDMGETHYYQVSETATYVFEKNETLQLAPYHRTFDAKKIWQRLLILFAGPFMNFVLAFVLYLIIAFATGVPNYDSNRVGTVSNGYPAASFLAPGDLITSVNGVSTKSWTDFQREMDKIMIIMVQR
jgi:regulator of sigma E protease